MQPQHCRLGLLARIVNHNHRKIEMKEPSRTREEIVEEISLLKQRISELEQSETAHVKTLEALQRSEMKFRTLYDSTSDAVLLMDRDHFFDCNGAAVRLFGCATREELCGIHPADLSPPVQACGTESRVLGDRHIAMALTTGPQQFEWAHKRADTGEVFPSEVFLSPMIIDGRPLLQAVVRDITRQKRMEEALLKEIAFNSTLVESSPAFFVAINADRTVRHMNASMLGALGYNLEEVKNKDYMRLVPESDRERLSPVFSRLITLAQPTFNENRVLTRDGKEVLVEWHGRAIKKPDGSPDYFFGVGTDVTDRRRAEAMYRSIFDNALEGIFRSSPDGRLLTINSAFARISGFDSPEEMMGSITDIGTQSYVDPAKRQEALSILDREGKLDDFEFQIYRKDGSIAWVSTNCRTVYDDQGKPAVYEGFTEDITARKQAEEELWESKQKFQGLVETVYDWVWEVDRAGRYTYVSPQIKHILGYEPEEVLGKTAFDLMAPEEAKRMTEVFAVFAKKERPLVALENVNVHKDGHLVVLETDGLPFYDAAGDLKGYRGTDRDITGRKKMEEELRASREHLEQLVAERTAELREEIARREDRENELSVKSKTLEEVNTALRVLLKQREEDRKELEVQFVSNIRTMILPHIRKIRKEQLTPRHEAYLNVVEANLAEILSPFLNMIKQFGLTPKETEVVSFIREGKTTKDIARLMGVAPSAVDSHRDNIRKKLGLNNKKANLRTHLLSLK